MLKIFSFKISTLCVLGACFGITGSLQAQNAIKMTDGEGDVTVFMLGDNPTVKQTDSELTVESLQTTLTCSISGGVRFEFIDYSQEEGNNPGDEDNTEDPGTEDPTPSQPDDSDPTDDPQIKDEGDAGVDVLYNADKVFVITADAVEGKNLKAGETVTLTDLAGKISAVTQTDTQGYFSISTAGFAPGIYVLKSVDKSFKFVIR